MPIDSEALAASEIPAPDPIAALTELNAATEAFHEAERGIVDARARYNAAERKLNEVQRQFDALYRQLRGAAPEGSFWEKADNPF